MGSFNSRERSSFLFALTLLPFILSPTPAPAQAASDSTITLAINAYMTTMTTLRRFNGAVLVARDGKVLAASGWGMADMRRRIPNTPATRIRIASITKQFTAMAILILQERGKLSVQDSLASHFPGSPDSWKAITLHHLLTHTSGLPDYYSYPPYDGTPWDKAAFLQVLESFKRMPLLSAPGERFNYSNAGYMLLSRIVELVSGQAFGDFLKQNVFDPLQMNDSGFDMNQQDPRHALGYRPASEFLELAPDMRMANTHGAGALYSSVQDLLKWDQALYTEKLVSRRSLDAMFTPFKDGYAYGWGVGLWGAHRVFNHGGGVDGFSSLFSRYPDDRLCIAILGNAEGISREKIMNDLTAIALGEAYPNAPRLPARAALAPETLGDYAGRYRVDDREQFVVSCVNGRLYALCGGSVPRELWPASSTFFMLVGARAGVTFERDAQGRIKGLILTQADGSTTRAEKMPPPAAVKNDWRRW